MGIFSFNAAKRADELYQKGSYLKAAQLYEKAERWEDAAQVYHKKLGDIDKAVEAYEKLGRGQKAAEILEGEGRYRDAIAKYQQAGLNHKAAEASLKNKQPLRAAKFFEQADRYERAAECYLDGGDVDSALRVLEKEGDELRQRSSGKSDQFLDQRLRHLDRQRADLLEKLGRRRDAARLLIKLGRTDRAAGLFEKAGATEEAARAYISIGKEKDALRLVEDTEDVDPELKAEILANAGRQKEAGEIFEEIGKLAAAASAFQAAGDLLRAADLWRQEESFRIAADLYHQAGKYYDAATCFARAQEHKLAAESFVKAGSASNAADAYVTAEEWLKAAEQYLVAENTEDALKILQSIEVEDDAYVAGSLLLVPILVDAGLEQAAQERLLELRDLREQGREIVRHEFFYCQARFLEARGKFPAAEKAYQKVLADRIDFRDTVKRHEMMRARIASEKLLQEEDTTGVTRALEAERNSTQRIGLKPSKASTGTHSFAPDGTKTGADTGTRPRTSSTKKSHSAIIELPVTIEDRIEPWWHGADFLLAKEKETGEQVHMVSFPLAVIGERVGAFQHITRQVSTIQHRAILTLKRAEVASDKVLLIYEAFDGQTLSSALSENRSFTPRMALHIIQQLCEALTSAHKLGVTHQWLSPKTILINHENHCRMVGVGLREFLDVGTDSTSRAYLSPEVRQDLIIGPTSDIYSLGLLAMELLGAQLPMGLDRMETLDDVEVKWSDEVREELPSSLLKFLVRCLESNPLARPQTSELGAALSSIGFVPGQVLSNRYEILGEIGRGGMSRVYKARDQDLGGEVAIKSVITPALGRTEDEERLFREVQISRRITHSNVVRVHDMGRFPGGIFIIMELLEGPGLDEVISQEAPLELERTRNLVIEIASALGEAHRLQIVHRDLKPGNVILVGGRAKVLDFGIARMSDDSSNHLTRTGEVIGSPLYMAPEQIQGLELDGKCDLYALGVITYTLLSGKEPFVGSTPTAVVMKHLNEAPPDIQELRPGLPKAWAELLQRLMAKKPEDRYPDAAALIEALKKLPTEDTEDKESPSAP